MSSGFLSLPLELRNRVYEYALEDDVDILLKGVPSILRVSTEITRQIYEYRNITTTIEYSGENDIPANLAQRVLDFKKVPGRKQLIVKIKPLTPLPVRTAVDDLLSEFSDLYAHTLDMQDWMAKQFLVVRARFSLCKLAMLYINVQMDETCECVTAESPEDIKERKRKAEVAAAALQSSDSGSKKRTADDADLPPDGSDSDPDAPQDKKQRVS
jgi:hypothetical protein